jgi:alkyl hydroperoxide reductase subunit AhpC
MTVHLGDVAPDSTQESTEDPISFHSYLGDAWGILLSHPADFTPVCTTELGAVANDYDMIPPNAPDNATVRTVFIVGPDKKVKLTPTYPAGTGRNVDEILRVIDSLQLTARHKLATPANWKQGEDCIIVPAVTNDEARELFPSGFKEVKPYLRTTKAPTG